MIRIKKPDTSFLACVVYWVFRYKGFTLRLTAKINPQKIMNKKHVIVALLAGVVLGYVAQNYVRKIPVIGSKLPVLS